MLQIVCDEAARLLAGQFAVAGAYEEHVRLIRSMSVCGVSALIGRALLPPFEALALPEPPVVLVEGGPGGTGWPSGRVVTVGLRYDRRLVGVLVLGFPADRASLTPDEQSLLLALANLASQALVSATRLAAARVRTDDLEAINTLSRALAETLELDRIFELLYEAVLELLPPVEGAIFSLFDAERQEIRCAFALLDGERIDPAEFPVLPLVAPGKGFQSDVIHTRRPVVLGSLEEIYQSNAAMHIVGDTGAVSEAILFVPMLSRERVVGVLQVQSFEVGTFSIAHATKLGLAANVAAVAIENARLVVDLQRSNRELLEAYDSTLEGWSRALDLRDQETQGHSQRVTELTILLARAAGMNEEEIKYVRWGALLHDIGKVGIPDAVLLKPGALDEEDWRIMRLHPVYAYSLLSPIAFLHASLDIPYCHHERWDGTGYPRGLRGEEIPLAARLFAVVDIWDALRSERPYRSSWPEERVRAHISGLAGSHLDPAVVTLFFAVLDRALVRPA